ncbi:MAG: hypothetical protein J0J13_15940, partial [Devosia sp.]|nr:hypothetical protein [Devosia sp.]
MINLSALDNPAWNALIDGHRQIAERNGRAARYPAAMSPIAGLERYTAEGFEALKGLVPKDDVVGLVTGSAYDAPEGWAQLGEIVCDQMVCEAPPGAPDVVPARLELPDVPAMVELAMATEAGPFRAGTIGMGRYYGLKSPDGR